MLNTFIIMIDTYVLYTYKLKLKIEDKKMIEKIKW